MPSTNASPVDPGEPVMTVNTVQLTSETPQAAAPASPNPDSVALDDPKGTDVAAEQAASRGESADPATGTGVDGEIAIWEARYSKRNFIGRIGFRILATIAAAVLAYFTWANGHEDLAIVAWIAIAATAILWVGLIYRMVQAHYSHYYRLTNRRLFVSTGVVNRRRDMLELLRVKDVFTRQQSLMERWLGLGTVVVEPNDKSLPTFYLAGVDDPKEVMDLIWHHARSERDHRSVKVDSV